MVSIALPTDKKGKPSFEPELFEHEIFAIGYVTVQWGFMEHVLLRKTVELCERIEATVPPDAMDLQFKRRMGAFRETVKKVFSVASDQAERDRLLKIATDISGQERNRNRITHGLWDWHPKAPEKVRASSFRPPYQFEESFDFSRLLKVGKRIGELCFEIEYPGGKEEAYESLAQRVMQSGGSISRLGLLMMTGKLPPEHPLADTLGGAKRQGIPTQRKRRTPKSGK